MRYLYLFILLSYACMGVEGAQDTQMEDPNLDKDSCFLVVLGTIQDAGSPHIA